MSDNVAGEKAGLTWAMHIAVAALVVLWLIPTVGLFVSSFREHDQISATGWWLAPFSVELAFRGRANADAPRQEDGVWVVEGNIFDDPEVQKAFATGSGSVTAFGTRGAAPGEFPAGETADLGDGETLTLAADGTYRFTSAEEITGNGQRIYFEASTPPRFTLDNYRTVLTSDGIGRAFINSLTVTIPATIIPILIAAFAAYALAWMDFPGRGLLIAVHRRPARRAAADGADPAAAASTPGSASARAFSASGSRTPASACRSRSTCCATTWSACRATSSRAPRSTAPPTSRSSSRSCCRCPSRRSPPSRSSSSSGSGTTSWWPWCSCPRARPPR